MFLFKQSYYFSFRIADVAEELHLLKYVIEGILATYRCKDEHSRAIGKDFVRRPYTVGTSTGFKIIPSKPIIP